MRSRFLTDLDREREREVLERDEADLSRFLLSASRSLLRRVFSFDFGLSLDFEVALLLP